MLRILSGTLCNFLAIGNVTQSIDLSIDGLTLILGENRDIGGTNSRNGVGKTALLQAISYGLFGKPLTKIRLDNLTNNINNKAMLVTIDFESNGIAYRIERGRKPTVLRFFKNGIQQKEPNEAQGETKHTQTEIERILGMGYIMFRHVVALNTSTTPFLREEASVQREVIEELFGITQLSQRAEALKALIDLTKDQTRDADATVKANGEANARITLAIGRAIDEAATWRAAQHRRVADFSSKAEALLAIDLDYELAVFDQIDQWQQQQREYDGQRQQYDDQIATLAQDIARLRQEMVRHDEEGAFDEIRQIDRLTAQAQSYLTEAQPIRLPQIDRLRAEVTRRQQEAEDHAVEADRLGIELAAAQDRLARPAAHHCITCGQGLAGTDHLATVMANLTTQCQQIGTMIEHASAGVIRARSEAALAETEIVQLQHADQDRRALTAAKAAALQADIEQVQNLLDTKRARWTVKTGELRTMLETMSVKHQNCIDQRKVIPQPAAPVKSAYRSRDAVWQVRQERDLLVNQLETELTKPNPNDAKIEGLQSTLIVVDFAPLNELTLRLKHETFLLKLLTAKDSFIRKKLIDQNLSYLNKRLNHFLDRLGLPHEVAFKADLGVEISLLGHEFDFEQLSRGEMNRVILATAFSFRDVWQNLNQALNLMFVDECLDQGTDGAGVENAVAILKDMAVQGRSIFLISHREELQDQIDHVLRIRKEQGFTTFA